MNLILLIQQIPVVDSALEVSDGKVSFGNINVGIGTDDAQVPLHISARPAIRFTDTEQPGTANFEIANDNDKLGFFNHPIDNILTITASNNAGIGNDAPLDSFKLNVSGNVYIGDDKDITPKDGGASYGQLLINGNGYNIFVSLDQNAMWVGHNSEIRDLHLTLQMKLLT